MVTVRDRSRLVRWSGAFLGIVLCVPVLTAAATRVGPTLDSCAQSVRDRPDELESYRCYWFVARRGDPAGATQALESLLAIDSDDHRARLYLAAVEADLGRDRAEQLYREAADGFVGWGEPTGEVYARLSLSHILRRRGQRVEAAAELERAARTAEASGDPILEARVWSIQASAATGRGAHGEALRLLRKAERVGNRTAEARARLQIGRFDRSDRGIAELERARALYRGLGVRLGERQATRELAYSLWETKPDRRPEAYRMLDEAIEDARSTGDIEEQARGLYPTYALPQADSSRHLGDSSFPLWTSPHAVPPNHGIRLNEDEGGCQVLSDRDSRRCDGTQAL